MKSISIFIIGFCIFISTHVNATIDCVSRLNSEQEESLADWVITGTITEVDSTNGTISLGQGDAVVSKGVISTEGNELPISIPVASHCWRLLEEEKSWKSKKVIVYGINKSDLIFVHKGYISVRPLK